MINRKRMLRRLKGKTIFIANPYYTLLKHNRISMSLLRHSYGVPRNDGLERN